MQNPKRTGPILDEEIQGLFKPIPISRSLKTDSETYKFARDTKADIQAFNKAIREKTVYGLLSSTDQFLHRGFGMLHLSEIFLSRSANGNIQLMAKCKCRCGNYLTVPLREVINGNVMSCGCITPIPKSVLKSTTVYQSQKRDLATTSSQRQKISSSRHRGFRSVTLPSALVHLPSCRT